jgi:4-carboxymuconolactone decarboxylase
MHVLEAIIEQFRAEPLPQRQRELLIGAIAAATTMNQQSVLEYLLVENDEQLSVTEIEEIILQTLLFAGFPVSIEALATLRKHIDYTTVEHSVARLDRGSGEQLCKRIYGERYQRLLNSMDRLHPDLTDWILEDGYGRVLSRPGLAVEDRERAVLVTLMATGMQNQFRAHLRGCLNLGMDPDGILWFTNCFEPIIAANKREDFRTIIKHLLSSNSGGD